MPGRTQNDPDPTEGDAERDPAPRPSPEVREPPAGRPDDEQPLKDPPGQAPERRLTSAGY